MPSSRRLTFCVGRARRLSITETEGAEQSSTAGIQGTKGEACERRESLDALLGDVGG